MSKAPHTATLVADTALAVSLDGVHSTLTIRPLTASQVVYARADGVTAVGKADGCYACPPIPAEAMSIAAASTDGSTTVVSLISSTPGDVQVLIGGDCD